MTMQIFIAPHERYDAIDAYHDWLTDEQIEHIKNAPDDAGIHLVREDGQTKVWVVGHDD